jgi:cytochrome oxidase Cu insertion factor (SCO1/SenC/PrrC family)
VGRLVTILLLLVGCASTEWRSTTASERSKQVSLFSYPWVWVDDHGEQVSLSRWRGTQIVMTTVFTDCNEVCPRTLDRLREIDDQFRHDNRHAELVVVSMDAQPATAAELAEYKRVRRLPTSWHLLSGDRAQTEQLLGVLDIHLMDMESHVVHEAKITAFDVDGFSTDELDVH